jgi:hypothetical protein
MREHSSLTLSRQNVGAEVLTAVVMKISVFWDISPQLYVEIQPTFNTGFLFGLLSNPEDGGDMFFQTIC